MTTPLTVPAKPLTIVASDLYCGAGGASAGLHAAAKRLGFTVNLTAVNHWETAIATHSANYPDAVHLQTEVEKVKPREAVPGGKLKILLAGPSCVHFSQARGGKPVSDQQRSGAWEVIHWARELDIENILVENVPEFLTWGPVDAETGKAHKDERKGAYFRQWCRMLRDLGYTVEHRVLCAAHFGDATTRKRLFIQARKGKRIAWPKPTHNAPKEAAAMGTPVWRAAREIIDWKVPSQSVFGRKKQLADNTKKRIVAGLDKVCGIRIIGHESMSWERPPLVLIRRDATAPGKRLAFILGQQSCSAARSTDEPVMTVSTAGAISLIEASCIVVNRTHCQAKDLAEPVSTLTTGNNMAIVDVDAFAVNLKGTKPRQLEQTSQTLDEPLKTIHANGEHAALCQPELEEFIVPVTHSQSVSSPRGVSSPLLTITTAKGGEFAVAEACLVNVGGPAGASREPRSVDEPFRTLLGQNHTGVAEALLLRYNGGEGERDRSESLDAPLTTIDTSNRFGLLELEPSLVSYYGCSQGAYSVADPLDTVTTRDRFGLIESEIKSVLPQLEEGDTLAILDIRFRMLQPHELAAAHSFPSDYQFAGGREDRVKQVGNSWPVRMAEALCYAILSDDATPVRMPVQSVREKRGEDWAYETSNGEFRFYDDEGDEVPGYVGDGEAAA